MAAVAYYNKKQDMTGLDMADVFDSYDARMGRYLTNEAYYDNTIWSNLHSFSQAIKSTQPVLYDYIQTLYSPAWRLVNIQRSKIWAGVFDSSADDANRISFSVGERAKSKEKELLNAIFITLKNSDWDTNQEICPAMGAKLGDVFLLGVDEVAYKPHIKGQELQVDPSRGRVRIDIIHPAQIRDVNFDSRGFVKSYTRAYMRLDDDGLTSALCIVKVSLGDGDEVIFQTFRDTDSKPWQWPGDPDSEWTVDWGFIPLWHIQHVNEGLKFGLSEFHALKPKINAVEDKASMVHDAIRRMSIGKGLLAGLEAPADENPEFGRASKTSDNPEPGREQDNFVYGPAGASFTSMVFPMDLAAASAELQNNINDWKNDYPELDDDVWAADSRVEGVKGAKTKVEDKINSRRKAYNGRLAAALRGMIAIAGDAGYAGYEGFGLDSYDKGELDFTVSPRPVFPPSPSETRAEMNEFWAGWKELESNGVTTFRSYAESYKMPEAFIQSYEAEQMKARKANKTAEKL